jgi:hypothetical protein
MEEDRLKNLKEERERSRQWILSISKNASPYGGEEGQKRRLKEEEDKLALIERQIEELERPARERLESERVQQRERLDRDLVAANQQMATATERAAVASEDSAQSARRSASAAEDSARSAHVSARGMWTANIIALIALALAILNLLLRR